MSLFPTQTLCIGQLPANLEYSVVVIPLTQGLPCGQQLWLLMFVTLVQQLALLPSHLPRPTALDTATNRLPWLTALAAAAYRLPLLLAQVHTSTFKTKVLTVWLSPDRMGLLGKPQASLALLHSSTTAQLPYTL